MMQWAIAASLLSTTLCVLYIVHMRHKIRRTKNELGWKEHRFAASEKRTRAIIRAIPDLFFIINRNGIYLEYGAHDPSLLRLSDRQIIGKTVADLFPSSDAQRIESAIRSTLDRQELTQIQYMLEVPAGIRQFECRIVPLDADTVIFFSRDITSRLEREALIQKSLLEKEVLLREIHHRVKNNLQVISSMVSLQAEHFVDEHDRSLILDTQSRIQSMARLHEMLYQAENVAAIHVTPYLSSVIDELLVTFASDLGMLKIKTDIENLRISLDAALPLGLIVNELVLNSLKFFHPKGAPGLLSIDLHADGDTVRLSLLNDNSGVSGVPYIDESISFGYVLVPALVHQLAGNLTVLPGSPGNLHIEFPLKMLCGSVPADERTASAFT